MPTSTNSPVENEHDHGPVESIDDGVAASGGVEEAAESLHGAVAAAAVEVAEVFAVVLPDDHVMDEEPAAVAAAVASKPSSVKRKKKRLCKFPGCSNTVKAQGHCQRHGAKTKRCKAPGCNSQAQGSHDGYCKRHWREYAAPEDQRKASKKKAAEEPTTCEPIGSSVYDHILPASFQWKADGSGGLKLSPKKETKSEATEGGGMTELGNVEDVKKDVMKVKEEEMQQTELVPILQHILDNESLSAGWHRINERLARGICPPKSLSTQLESWEKQLAVMEMALIAGTDTRHLTVHRTSKILAHAWGREKGFHKLMIDKHCARRGDLDRKKRVDAGVPMSVEKKAVYKMKFAAMKDAKKRKLESTEEHETALVAQRVAEDYGGVVPVPPAMEPMAEIVGEEEQLEASGVEPFAQAPPPPPLEEPSIEEIMVTENV
ncbi:hypothetical protein ACHAXR_012424 [Thalassiosira sp. AJA248-18]